MRLDLKNIKIHDMPFGISILEGKKLKRTFVFCAEDKRKIRAFVTKIVEDFLEGEKNGD